MDDNAMQRASQITGALLLSLLLGAVAWLWAEPEGPQRPIGPLQVAAPAAVAEVELAAAAQRDHAAARAAVGGEGVRALDEAEVEADQSRMRDTRSSVLRGTLLDADTRAPLAGRRIALLAVFQHKVAPHEVVTDAEGGFELRLEPGEFMVLHRAEPGRGPRALPLEVTPRRVEVRAAADGVSQELTLLARRPPAQLEVEVRDANGLPASRALVEFACTLDVESTLDRSNRTDAEGRVSLAVWSPDTFRDGALTARDDAGNVSDVVSIAAPLTAELRRLVLRPGAALALQVLDADHSPVVARRVLLATTRVHGSWLYRETDAEGRLHFEGLHAGAYTLAVWLPEVNGWDERPLQLASGEERLLEVVLDRPARPVAVEGVVLDEEGRPLADVELGVAFDGRRAGLVTSDAEGMFRFRGPSTPRAELDSRIWVGANVAQYGDHFEPAELEVPFGTRGLVFRRVARAAQRSFEVDVHDRLTGAPIEGFVLSIYRGPGAELWGDSYSARRRFELRLLPGARARVKARGYIAREVDLVEALDRLEPGQRLRVGLDPGLDHSFQVFDSDTGAPIQDALFRSASAGDARTDEQGWVRLRSDHWSAYDITRGDEGYGTWDPEMDLLWGRGPHFFLGRE
jgi:hypothetical protein